jgi:hypothetical protein
MGAFKIKENLPQATRNEIDRISAIASALRLQSEADFLTALAPYLVNKVVAYDADGLIVSASGTTVPTGDSGFAKGAFFTKTNVTVSKLADSLVLSGKTVSLNESSPVNAVKATGTVDFSDLPANGNTLKIGSKTYTFKTALSTEPTVPNEILIGTTVADQLIHLGEAINGEAIAEGTDFSTGTTANDDVVSLDVTGDVDLEAKVAGTVGNVDLVKVGANITISGAKLAGGVDGTVGVKDQIEVDSTNLYICIGANTTSGTNWRKISLGSAY